MRINNRTEVIWKNLLIFHLLLLAVGFNSCKKDLLVPSSNSISKKDINLDFVTYSNFLGNINTNSLGFLKSKLNANTSRKLISINDNNSLGNLSIYTDSVQRIINKDDTSYIFKMALSSPKATTFRNLTIQPNKGKISAFITTYTPTSEWINARKNNQKIEFKGDISFASINLNGTNLIQGLATDQHSSTGGKVMNTGNQKMLMRTVCDTYILYKPVAYGCSDGNHMPWDEQCGWNTGQPVPEGHHSAGYNWVAEVRISCTDYDVPDPGSGGGGGGTTPNPPEDYDPCDGGLPTVSYAKVNNGLKLATLPPSPCDEGGGGLPPLIEDEGGSFNADDPGDFYTLKIIADSIKLAKRFECFNNVPDNAATTFSVKLYTELADKNRPSALLNSSFIPGHTFITMTKTNGNITVSETFGFYPESAIKASSQLPVKSMVVDNQGHDYHASLTISVTANQFTAMMNTAIDKAKNKYDMTGYNCTNFALDIFNQGRSIPLYVPDNIGFITGENYGKTPTGVYEIVKSMQENGLSGAAISPGKGIGSTNCN